MIPDPQLTGLVATLERARRPVLVTHAKPDGDALGSLLGLTHLLDELGADPQPICTDPVPLQYRFLPGWQRVRAEPPDEADLIVQLDCGVDRMTGLDPDRLPRAPLVDIDHHPKTGRPPTPRLAIYDAAASSTAEMITVAARFAGWPLRRPASTCLMTGLVTDTSAFRNTNVTPVTLTAAAELLRRGARLKEIIKHCFYNSSIAKLRLWGIAMARIEQHPQTAGVLSTILTAEDIAETGASAEDIEGLVNFLRTMPGVQVMLLLTDLRDGSVKGSLRAGDERTDVSRLARALGGGGHRQAAGFVIPGRLVQDADDSWRVTEASAEPSAGAPAP